MRHLFQPLFLGLRNRFLPKGQLSLRSLALLGFGFVLAVALYGLSNQVLGFFHRQSELGILLSLKLFQMLWVLLFAMLLFSSMVSGVSALYLSRDNEILLAAPVQEKSLFQLRYFSVLLYTSWMMVVFSTPVFLSFAKQFHAGLAFVPLLLVTLIAQAAMANAIGLSVIIVLVTLFPARRTRDIVVYLSLLFSILLFLVFRLLKPEDLADPEKFPDFMEYLAALQTPIGPLLPPSWAAELLSSFMREHQLDWLLFGLILLTPVICYLGGEWLMQRFFLPGFSKAQESFGGYRAFRAPPQKGSAFGWLVRKELKLFLRDSAEWSQLFLIAALAVMYLYNFKALPLDRSPIPTEYLSNLIGYANIALSGFLMASLSARFVYPSIGAEGEAFNLIRCSPLSLKKYLLYKYVFYLIPFSLLALGLLSASNLLLGISGPMFWISLITGLIITASVVAMALGFGALFADFKIESRAAVQGSFGTILFLFSALALELLIIGLGSYPAYRLTRSWLKGIPLSLGESLLEMLLLFLIFICSLFIARWCLQRGLRALEHTS